MNCFSNILKFDFAGVNPRSTISDVSTYDYRVYLFMIRATQDALEYNVGMQMYKKNSPFIQYRILVN